MYWWSDDNIEIVEINGNLYALYGWNGEEYNHCWKCADRYTVIDEDIRNSIREREVNYEIIK